MQLNSLVEMDYGGMVYEDVTDKLKFLNSDKKILFLFDFINSLCNINLMNTVNHCISKYYSFKKMNFWNIWSTFLNVTIVTHFKTMIHYVFKIITILYKVDYITSSFKNLLTHSFYLFYWLSYLYFYWTFTMSLGIRP